MVQVTNFERKPQGRRYPAAVKAIFAFIAMKTQIAAGIEIPPCTIAPLRDSDVVREAVNVDFDVLLLFGSRFFP